MIKIPLTKILFLDIETVGGCKNYTECKVNNPNVASQFENIKHKISADEYNEGCFIFKAQKFSSYTPILASEIEPDGQNVDDASSYLTFDFNESLIKLEGTLINFFIFRNDLN